MKAVRKLKTRFVWAVIAATGLCVVFCANPIDEPLKWRTKIEIPVTNNKFYLGQEMPGLLKNLKTENINILLAGISKAQPGQMYDSTSPSKFYIDSTPGDTVIFSILRGDKVSYETHEDSMETKFFHPVVGPISIGNVDTIKYALPLPPGTGVTPPISVRIRVPNIYQITFDSSSPNLSLKVTNTSTSAVAITNIAVTLFDSTKTIATLSQGQSQILSFTTSRKNFADSLRIQITESSAAAASKGLTLELNCNGLVASSLRAVDSVIKFQRKFTNDYELTDTLNVDYIDIQEGSFNYSLHNYTPIPLLVQVEQLHLWKVSYCARAGYVSFANMTGISQADSNINYYGFLTNGFTEVKKDSTWQIMKSNLSQCRLFPLWNPLLNNGKGKSVSRVTYTVKNPEPTGKILTISAGDSCVFSISSPDFVFKEMFGTVMQAYVREGDTAKIQVPFPFNKGSKDSLRGNFYLKKVIADIFMTPNLPDTSLLVPRRAYIDTLGVTYTLFNPDSASVKNTTSTKFTNVYNKKTFRHQSDMTNILNQWPDSMFIMVKINVPAGTHIRAINDLKEGDADWGKYMGRMMIAAYDTVRMNAVLDWEVRDTAHLDLGSGKFAIGKAYKVANKLQDKSFKFLMNARNNTNAFMNIYALAAPDSVMMKKLDTMSVNNTWDLILHPIQANAKGFVSLLGDRGVRIPARGRIDSSGVDLNEADLQKILNSDTCSFRWQARFIPYETVHSDALHDSDYIDIRSFVAVEGTNSMDSLLIWEKDTTN